MSAAITGLTAGQPPSIQGTGELLALAGLLEGQDLETSAQHLAATNLDNIERAIRDAQWEQWLGARRMSEAIYLYMRRRKSAESLLLTPEQRLPGLDLELPDDAFARGCLIPQQLLISGYERDFALRRARAMDNLAMCLESSVATASTVADDDEQRRAQAQVQLESWAQEHPEEQHLLLGIDPAASVPPTAR